MQRTATAKKKLPKTIGIKTSGLAPLIQKWADEHQSVPFSELLRRGLKKELQPYAGKRFAHLVDA